MGGAAYWLFAAHYFTLLPLLSVCLGLIVLESFSDRSGLISDQLQTESVLSDDVCPAPKLSFDKKK